MGNTSVRVFLTLLFGMAALLPCSCDVETDQERQWKESGHADAAAEAFRHWDGDDPAVIPTSCAKCHSQTGFLDFIGTDGTAAGTVDSEVAVSEDEVVSCTVCHTDDESGSLRAITSVTFPSGITIGGLGPEAICMQCHQGRASTADIDEAVTGAGVEDPDTITEGLAFINIHYYAAAASQFGTLAQGGYQYPGKSYDARFAHVQGVDSCFSCHSPHSLEIKTDTCTDCHTSVAGETDLKDIRTRGSLTDYDGDGSISEGIYYEIAGLQEKLYTALKAYGSQITETPIAYEPAAYPYFFIDTNADGQVGPDEAGYANRYTSWTARLLKAAYNYQVSQKDPGAFAHGGKYTLQLLYDSLEDLNAALPEPVSMAGLSRTDEGHFDGSAEAFRHWDEDGEVSASCSTCHSATGLPNYLATGETIAEPPANGLLCTTCHEDNTDLSSLRTVGSVAFPSGLSADLGDNSNLCLTCHQGREAKATVDNRIAGSEGPYGFVNIHYFAAAALFFGTEVQGGYEFEGRQYAGKMTFPSLHGGDYDTCVQCHMGDSHNVTELTACARCHGSDIRAIRPGGTPDYDGDGDTNESLRSEIQGLEQALLPRIQTYAAAAGSPIVYSPSQYPYFFNDTNADGKPDEDEAVYSNGYASFDAALLKAAYNYQTSLKEPGGYIHNARYVAQLLVDSIEALGGNISAYAWR